MAQAKADKVFELEKRIQVLEGSLKEHERSCTESKAKPIDIERLIVSPKIVVGIVMAVLAIAGSIWLSTAGLRSDVRDILTQQAAQSKLSDERSESLKESIADAKRLSELQRIQLESLTKTVLTQQRR